MILVFGQTGQVARELARLEPGARFLGRGEADLGDPAGCAVRISEFRPDAVINAAAWTAVDKAEAEEDAATVVNGAAPGAMARAAAALGVPFVHVSTDYVFDGAGELPFGEDDPVGPLGAYGRSKLEGERQVAAAGGRFAILRTSWVFSAHGSNFVKTMLRVGPERGSLNVVSDQVGGPTPAADIAAACLALAKGLAAGQGGGVYHFSGGPDVSWAGFARAIFDQAGLEVAVNDIPTSAYPTPARRPANSRLDNGRIARDFGIPRPDWREGLRAVLAELGYPRG